jgi:DNA polymerase I
MIVTEVSQFNQIKREIQATVVLGLDTETNFTDNYSDRYLLGLAIKTDANSWYVPVNHQAFLGSKPNNLEVPHDLFEGYTGTIVAHNAKFDLLVCRQAGIELPTDNLWCTMMMSVYVDENHIPGHDLDTVFRVYLGEQKKKVEASSLRKFGWEKAPVEFMAQYAEQDCQPLPELFQVLQRRSEPRHLKLWEEVDRPFMLLLAEMEQRGILIDRDLCATYKTQCEKRLAEIQQDLGFDPAKPSVLHPKLFADPPFGLGLSVPSLTPKSGKPQVSLGWLDSIGHPLTALVSEYRKTSKQLSSYFSAYLSVTTRENPRLHPNFKQNGGETGRLSCETPNLQQIPREEYGNASVKQLFLPEPGRQLWEVDFRTIEYRLQAVYAQSRKLIDLFEAEGDFHQLVADDISSKVGYNITRQKAKTINYLMSFGGGPGVLDKQLGVGINRAREIHEAYKLAYPEIFDKSYEAQQVAELDMEIDLWTGRTRHFKFPSDTHKAFNAVIQGGAFAIVQRSMLKLQEEGYMISNCVHDSVWLNVNNEAEVKEAQEVMSGWTKDYFGLSFTTDRKLLHV